MTEVLSLERRVYSLPSFGSAEVLCIPHGTSSKLDPVVLRIGLLDLPPQLVSRADSSTMWAPIDSRNAAALHDHTSRV